MAEDTISGEPGPPVSGADIRTFLFADMRGYTRYTQEHGDEAASALAGRFADVVKATVPGFEGELLELRGDEALCVFRSARQALRASVELQRRLRTATGDDPAFPIGVGMGLDAGEAVPTHGGYRGASLNLAARLCARAEPGQILATAEVVHLARRVDGVRLAARRALRLKGIAEPVRAVEVCPEPPLPPAPVFKPPAARRLPLAVVGVAGVAALAALVGAFLLWGRSGGGATARASIAIRKNSVAAIDPKTGRVLRDVGVNLSGFQPHMAAGGGAVWTYSTDSQNLYRIDPKTFAVQPFGIGITPNGIAFSGGRIWLVDGWDTPGVLLSVDARSPTIRSTRRLPPHTTAGASIAAGPRSVWVGLANDNGGTSLMQIDPRTGTVEYRSRTPSGPLAVDAAYVWMQQFNHLTEIRPMHSSTHIPGNPAYFTTSYLTAGFGDAWFAAGVRVWTMSPDPVSVSGSVTLPSSPDGITVGGGLVWVATRNEILGISPDSDRITRRIRLPIHLPTSPSAIVFYDGRLWIAAT